MTPKEMHIAVEQGLQKQGSFIFDDYLSEEIDGVLNKQVKRFIDDKFRKDRTSEGFSIEQGDLDDLQFLIEKDKEYNAYIDSSRQVANILIPSDYLYLINDRTFINFDCSQKTDFASSIVPYNSEYTIAVEFPDSTASSEHYKNLRILIGNTIVFDITDYPEINGLIESNQKFLLINLILDTIRQQIRSKEIPIYEDITDVYWESFRGKYYKDTFIFVTTKELLNNFINWDNYTNEFFANYTLNLFKSNLTFTDEVENRLTKSQVLHSILKNNVYTRTVENSPVSNLSKDKLFVYYTKRFIPVKIVIDYIRIPRDISLILNQSCELKENTHERICDLAVEYIKNTIEQPSYESKVKDNLLRGE